MTLQGLLERYYRPRGTLGDASDRDALIRDLEQHYKLNVRLYVGLLVTIVLAVGTLAFWALSQPDVQGKNSLGMLTALAGGAGAALELARRCVREWSQARLLLAVAHALPQQDLTQLIAKLLEPAKP